MMTSAGSRHLSLQAILGIGRHSSLEQDSGFLATMMEAVMTPWPPGLKKQCDTVSISPPVSSFPDL